jgi:RNA polymerase sigma-70 factor (ECF subfamily)
LPQVYGYIRHLVHNEDDAWDLVSQTFHKALPYFTGFRLRPLRVKPLLFRIATNEVNRHRRRRQRRPESSLDDLVDRGGDPPEGGLSPHDQAASGQENGRLHAALARLEPEIRHVVILHYWYDLTCQEIAAEVGRPDGTVKAWLARGRARLRQLLDEEGRGAERAGDLPRSAR